MRYTSEHFEAVCAALGVDPSTTTSVNITKQHVYIVPTDQAAISQLIVAEPSAEPGE